VIDDEGNPDAAVIEIRGRELRFREHALE
jgi:hypothetical protein